MVNTYREKTTPQESLCGSNTGYGVSLLIELDLRGIERPKSFPLSEVLLDKLQAQKPETAHIFLCCSLQDAKMIFECRQIKSSMEYIDRIPHAPGFQHNIGPSEDVELIRPYDPQFLVDWLQIQPGQVSRLRVSEYVARPLATPADQLAVQSQIHLIRGAENRYMAVWFDFREQYNLYGRLATAGLDDLAQPNLPFSAWQRRFACQSRGLLNGPIRHAMDFPSFMLLDLLNTDLIAFGDFVSITSHVRPVATHATVVTGSLEKRLNSFELTQSMIQKAERIHRLVTHMSSRWALDLVTIESRISYEQELRRLEMGSSFLASELRQWDELADKRLSVHNRFAQLRQASSLSALTYCAAFFLPLSLAAAFLSMQTRAKELKWLVYDFCGVTLVFCTIAALIYFLSWVISAVKTRRLNKRLEKRNASVHTKGVGRFLMILFGLAWMSAVAAFLVGMLHDLRMGLIMLAAPVGIIVLPITCVVSIGEGAGVGLWLMQGGLEKSLRPILGSGGSNVGMANMA
jgi:hypothetical protein